MHAGLNPRLLSHTDFPMMVAQHHRFSFSFLCCCTNLLPLLLGDENIRCFLEATVCHDVHQVDLRSEFERSEDPQSLLVEDAELRVSKRQGRIAQVSSTLVGMTMTMTPIQVVGN